MPNQARPHPVAAYYTRLLSLECGQRQENDEPVLLCFMHSDDFASKSHTIAMPLDDWRELRGILCELLDELDGDG
jgi:hypothetical protein